MMIDPICGKVWFLQSPTDIYLINNLTPNGLILHPHSWADHDPSSLFRFRPHSVFQRTAMGVSYE